MRWVFVTPNASCLVWLPVTVSVRPQRLQAIFLVFQETLPLIQRCSAGNLTGLPVIGEEATVAQPMVQAFEQFRSLVMTLCLDRVPNQAERFIRVHVSPPGTS